MGDKIRLSNLSEAQQARALKFDKDKNGKLKKQEIIDFKQSIVKANSTKSQQIAEDISLYLHVGKKALNDSDFKNLFKNINKGNILDVLAEFEKIEGGKSMFLMLLKEGGDKENLKKIMGNLVSSYLEATGHKGKPSEKEVNGIVERLCKHPKGLRRNSKLALLNEYLEPMKKQGSSEIADGLCDAKANNKKFIKKPRYKVLMEKVDTNNVDEVLDEYKNKNGTDLIDDIENSKCNKKHRRSAIGSIMRKQINFAENDTNAEELLNQSLNKEKIGDVKNLRDVLRYRDDMSKLASYYEQLSNPAENGKLYAKFLMNQDSLSQSRKDYERVTGKSFAAAFAGNYDKTKDILTMLNEETHENTKNKQIEKIIKQVSKNGNAEEIAALEQAIKISDDPAKMAEFLQSQVKNNIANLEKSDNRYLLYCINEKNVQKFLSTYVQASGGEQFTSVLLKAEGKENKKHLKNIKEYLVNSNRAMYEDKKFQEAYNLSYREIKRYAKKCDTEEEITEFVRTFIDKTPDEVADNLVNIAERKSKPTKDVAFKLALANLEDYNMEKVFKKCKEKTGKTPVDLIMEGGSSYKKRAALINTLYDKLGETGNQKEFQDAIKTEGKIFHKANPQKLNELMEKNFKHYRMHAPNPIIKSQELHWQENTHTKTSRNDIRGEKIPHGYSWEYEGLKDIKTLDDVAKKTGLSKEYLQEYISREGKKSKSYLCGAGHETIGIGHDFSYMKKTNPKEYGYLMKATLTDAQIYQIFANDMLRFISAEEGQITHPEKLSNGEFEALLDLSFNAGEKGAPTLHKCVNEAIELRKEGKDYEAQLKMYEAASHFEHQSANKKVLPGLCERRIHNILKFTNITNPREQLRLLDENKGNTSNNAHYNSNEYEDFAQLSSVKLTRNRLVELSINWYCSAKDKETVLNKICKLLNITRAEFKKLDYPKKGYKLGDMSEAKWAEQKKYILSEKLSR